MTAADHGRHKMMYFVLCALCMMLFATTMDLEIPLSAGAFLIGTVVAACKVGIHTGAAAELSKGEDA